MKKLVAALACRNKGSRLYGKPLQNLDISGQITVLDNIVSCLDSIDVIDALVLGIAHGVENDVFVDYATKNGLSYIRGDEVDVLGRLIQCGEVGAATDVFRTTSESPFLFFDVVNQCWEQHVKHNNDATFLDDIVDGCGFEIISLDALKKSHRDGEDRHRSELCSLFIRDHKSDFIIEYVQPPKELVRTDLRLTVDYPEDLVVCRAIYDKFKHHAPNMPLLEVVKYLDSKPDLVKLIAPYCEDGYSTMYL